MKANKNLNRQDQTDRKKRNQNEDIGNVEFGSGFLEEIPNQNTQKKNENQTNNIKKIKIVVNS